MIQLLIQINGKDKPGVTSSILGAMPDKVELLDISQAVVQEHLNLSLLIKVSKQEQSSVLMQLLISSKEIGMSLDFEILDNEYSKKVANYRVVCTVLCEKISGSEFGKLASCFSSHGFNIKDINKLSSKPGRRVFEIIGEGDVVQKEYLRNDLFDLYRDGLNIAVQTDDAFRRNKRVVIFDMDSTLVDGEYIDELANAYGVKDKVCEITSRAMQGKLDYRASFNERLKLLKGMPKVLVDKVAMDVKLNPGADYLIKILKSMGLKIGIISGGFDVLAEKLKKELALDYAFSNKLFFDRNNLIAGEVVEPLIDREYKKTILKTVESFERIRHNQIIAVGDGANDLDMLQAAGLGIAFHAKPKVQEQAKVRLNHFDLDSILYLMGLSDFEIERLKI